eukprot:symbB.v1.2.015371.t1/scaffold1146.1/size135487/3
MDDDTLARLIALIPSDLTTLDIRLDVFEFVPSPQRDSMVQLQRASTPTESRQSDSERGVGAMAREAILHCRWVAQRMSSLPMWCMAQADMSWLLAQSSLLETGFHAAAPTATTTTQHWAVTWCSSSTVA